MPLKLVVILLDLLQLKAKKRQQQLKQTSLTQLRIKTNSTYKLIKKKHFNKFFIHLNIFFKDTTQINKIIN